jgi:hypothetical protein
VRITLLALLFAVGATPHLVAFDFYDSSGRRYRSTHLAEDIQRRYGFRSTPCLVLVQTPSISHADYRRQMAILDHLDAERLSLLYVVSSRSGLDRDRYHTTPKTAADLAANHSGFRVTLFSATGAVLARADRPFSASEVQRALAHHRKPNSSSSKSPNQALERTAARRMFTFSHD